MIVMNAKHNSYGIFSIVGLILLLGLAMGFDALMAFLQQNIETFGSIIFWSYALTTALLAAASLFLFWFLLNRVPRNVWVALIFLLAGSFVVAYPALYMTPALPWLSVPLWLTSRSYVIYSGGLIAMMGLFALVLPRGK
jgi:hypothetical protein